MKPLQFWMRNTLAVAMCVVIPCFQELAFAGSGALGDPAGQVTGLTAVASSNGIALQNKDTVRVDELLRTDGTGHLRIQLHDGSIVNLGPNSQVKVTKRDMITGSTSIYLASGQLRCRVTKQHSGSTFQVTTPEGRVNVVGTDFYVSSTAGRTQVIAYSGIVSAGAGIKGSIVDVAAGQYVIVDRSGISRLQLTSEDVEQDTMTATALPSEAPVVATNTSATTSHSHGMRNLLIGVGLAAGGIAGLLAARGGGSQTQNTNNPSQPSVPPIPAH